MTNTFALDLKAAQITLNAGSLLFWDTSFFSVITCDATNETAIQKLKNLRPKAMGQAIHVLVAHDAMLEKYVDQVPDLAYDILDLSDKPTIIIYDKPRDLPASLLRGDGSLGIYVAQDKFCRYLINQLKKPLAFIIPTKSYTRELKSSKEKGKASLTGVADMVNLQKESKEPIYPSVIQLATDGKVRVILE